MGKQAQVIQWRPSGHRQDLPGCRLLFTRSLHILLLPPMGTPFPCLVFLPASLFLTKSQLSEPQSPRLWNGTALLFTRLCGDGEWQCEERAWLWHRHWVRCGRRHCSDLFMCVTHLLYYQLPEGKGCIFYPPVFTSPALSPAINPLPL